MTPGNVGAAGGTVAARLADWACMLTPGQVPDQVRHAAARHLLDGLGTALAARRLGLVAPAVTVAEDLGGPPEATIIGGVRVSAPAAALANGALLHALDFDDTHAGGLVHATAGVLPAALAVGEQTGASGEKVLAAAVAGFETVCRIAMASPHGFHARGLHATGVAAPFAAAIVTARLLGLSPDATRDALGIAGSSSAGLLEFLSTGASTKQLHPGSGAMNGIIAARLAAQGATGPASVLEGPQGVYAALSGRPADVAAVTAALGESWEVTKITVKPYPACQLLHAALDATAAARAQGPLDPAEITGITAVVHPDSASVVCEPADVKITPRTTYDAKFSLPWTVAALLVDGHVDVGTFSEASIRRPEVATLASRVTVRLADARGVAADAPGEVVLTLRDGTVRVGTVARSTGGPLSPLSEAALRSKFLRNAGGGPAARELADVVLSLAAEPSLRRVMDLTARARKE